MDCAIWPNVAFLLVVIHIFFNCAIQSVTNTLSIFRVDGFHEPLIVYLGIRRQAVQGQTFFRPDNITCDDVPIPQTHLGGI